MAKQFDLKHEDIYIAGHSAGAVVALQVAAHSQEPLGGIHVHCGAILDPASLPKSNGTPIFVFHSENDMVFSWDERYLPMKKALIEKGYNCSFVERAGHGHSVRGEDIKAACKWGLRDGD
jgi:predicted esterase